MRVTFRPTIAEDIGKVVNLDLPHRIRAITALAGEEVLGFGGIGFRPDGTVIAFAVFKDEFRKYPAAVHRSGVLGMRLIRESGVRAVLAEAQPGNAAAEPWLVRFGFKPLLVNGEPAVNDGKRVFVWERSADAAEAV